MVRILLIDENDQDRRTFTQILSSRFRVSAHPSGTELMELVRRENPDLIFLETNLQGMSGIELIPVLNGISSPPGIIMYSSVSDTATVVQAIRAGAFDYIVKPALLATLESTIRRALAQRLAARRCGGAPGNGPLDAILGRSEAVSELKELIASFAPSADPILILGESGTGKELTARTIHRLSPRCGGPFIPVNCAAIPDSLFEAEMFGVEKGAYTDAIARTGFIERADGGTLFLDEIGEMSAMAQSKLLRVLEDHIVRRIGATREHEVDVRIVAATNTDLRSAVAAKTFRRDLFYRINILRIPVPPLRSRPADIPELAVSYVGDKPGLGFTDAALRKLLEYDWPGNVRELHAIVKRASILARDGRIEPRHVRFY